MITSKASEWLVEAAKRLLSQAGWGVEVTVAPLRLDDGTLLEGFDQQEQFFEEHPPNLRVMDDTSRYFANLTYEKLA